MCIKHCEHTHMFTNRFPILRFDNSSVTDHSCRLLYIVNNLSVALLLCPHRCSIIMDIDEMDSCDGYCICKSVETTQLRNYHQLTIIDKGNKGRFVKLYFY